MMAANLAGGTNAIDIGSRPLHPQLGLQADLIERAQ
jgi:hypothetical protein